MTSFHGLSGLKAIAPRCRAVDDGRPCARRRQQRLCRSNPQCAAAEAGDPRPVDRAQADPAVKAKEISFVANPAQPEDPLAVARRTRGDRRDRLDQAENRSRHPVRLQFGRDQRDLDAVGAGARQGAHESQPEGFDIRGRRPHRCDRQRRLQPGPLRAPRRYDQALSGRQITASPAPISSPSATARPSRRIRTRRWTRSTAASRSSTWTPRPRRSDGRKRCPPAGAAAGGP